jgi:hypothetical protein
VIEYAVTPKDTVEGIMLHYGVKLADLQRTNRFAGRDSQGFGGGVQAAPAIEAQGGQHLRCRIVLNTQTQLLYTRNLSLPVTKPRMSAQRAQRALGALVVIARSGYVLIQ